MTKPWHFYHPFSKYFSVRLYRRRSWKTEPLFKGWVVSQIPAYITLIWILSNTQWLSIFKHFEELHAGSILFMLLQIFKDKLVDNFKSKFSHKHSDNTFKFLHVSIKVNRRLLCSIKQLNIVVFLDVFIFFYIN